MRTRAKRKCVASDRARRERFASETLCSDAKMRLAAYKYESEECTRKREGCFKTCARCYNKENSRLIKEGNV